jgi:hypothetical protein
MAGAMGRARDLVEALIGMGRPFRARDLERRGVDPWWLNFIAWPRVVRLERGVYADGQATFPRIAIAMVRVHRSFACLSSALWLHGLLKEEPPEAWLCIHHKAWKPTPPATPTRIVRTSVWPKEEDFAWTSSGLVMTSLPRTVIDFFRYKRLMPASAGPEALSLALESGKCTMADIEACAARYRVRWRAS